jgi:hypothetical protein
MEPGTSGSVARNSVNLNTEAVKIRIHETIILPVILYGHETWSLTLREECRLRVFEVMGG